MSTTYPNILYLHSHDSGRFVQPYGHAIDTPHIQQPDVLKRFLHDDRPIYRPTIYYWTIDNSSAPLDQPYS